MANKERNILKYVFIVFVHLLFQFVQLKSWILCMFTRELMLLHDFVGKYSMATTNKHPKKNDENNNKKLAFFFFFRLHKFHRNGCHFSRLFCAVVWDIGKFCHKIYFLHKFSFHHFYWSANYFVVVVCVPWLVCFFFVAALDSLFILRMTASSVQQLRLWSFIKFTVAGYAKTWQHFTRDATHSINLIYLIFWAICFWYAWCARLRFCECIFMNIKCLQFSLSNAQFFLASPPKQTLRDA